jgi:hypothetical protein
MSTRFIMWGLRFACNDPIDAVVFCPESRVDTKRATGFYREGLFVVVTWTGVPFQVGSGNRPETSRRG